MGHLARLTRERHSKFQNTIYHLEPHLKDSPGGLRDFQVLRWAQKLGESAHPEELAAARDFLFNVRCAHARDFRPRQQCPRFRHAGPVQPEDPARLMREYFRSARAIFRACGNLLDVSERRSSTLFARFRDRRSRLSNSDFSVVRDRVHFRTPQQATSDASLVERLFAFVARHGIPLAPDTQDRLLAHLPPLKTRVARRSAKFCRCRTRTCALHEMHATGVLQAIFPEFVHLDSLVVRDFYHRYTVDEHTLVAIGTLAALKRRQGQRVRRTDRRSAAASGALSGAAVPRRGEGNRRRSHGRFGPHGSRDVRAHRACRRRTAPRCCFSSAPIWRCPRR